MVEGVQQGPVLVGTFFRARAQCMFQCCKMMPSFAPLQAALAVCQCRNSQIRKLQGAIWYASSKG